MFNSMHRFVNLSLVVAIIACLGCGQVAQRDRTDPQHLAAIKQWQEARIKSLKSKTGWLNLAGLYWLKDGRNTFGAATSNEIVFPVGKAPNKIGEFNLRDGVVMMTILPGVTVTCNDSVVTTRVMRNDQQENATVASLGSLSWFIIKRGDQYGVRLRDYDSVVLAGFTGIATFPVDSSWRVTARLERYDPSKMIAIPTILNTIDEQPSPGALIFHYNGSEHRLDTTGDLSNDELFVIFADQTNGTETYGAGRFLYVNTPGEDGITVIDFNKAYNPPCAFTPYATCPLPPEQNYLKLRVTAGEKNYRHATH